MFEDYRPEEFCKEFFDLKRSSLQLVQIMAVIKGIKPLMDDWISVDRYDQYRRICRQYGLFVQPDAIFNITNISKKIIGKETLTTTVARGSYFKTSVKGNGSVHVFISRSKKRLQEGFVNGWYPLIIDGRVVDRPLIDAFKFGYGLGYPFCCVNFFQKFNNWYKYSHLYEIYKNSKKGAYHCFCNSLAKDNTYSYIYHMPCSYACAKTISLAREIRRAISEEEPGFVKKIDAHLQLPFLVFYEKKIYAFEGFFKNKRIFYKKIYFLGQMSSRNLYESSLKRGDCVFVDDGSVIILKKGRLIKKIKPQDRAFEREQPYCIQFSF